VNETNGSKVGDRFGPIFLRDKHDVCGVKPMKVVRVEVGEKIDHFQNVFLDSGPTYFEE
jgi:hypothetical protein